MGKIFTGAIKLASTIQPTGNQPLDDRVVVSSYADLLDKSTFGTAVYDGMHVTIAGTSDVYVLLDGSEYLDDTATSISSKSWAKIGADSESSIEKLITVDGDDVN